MYEVFVNGVLASSGSIGITEDIVECTATGPNTFKVRAVDASGNSATASFTVTVSVDDLVALVNAWVTGPGANGVKNSLVVKLTRPGGPQVGAFVNEVEAQSGKRLTAEQAAILIMLAEAL